MTSAHPRRIVAALVIGHVAGMIDLVALPIWIDALVFGFGYSPAQAGALPTSFLIGVVVASFVLSRRLEAVHGRSIAPLGYLLASLCLGAIPLVPSLGARLALHGLGGLGVGVALSMVHRTMGRTENPHRAFAYAGMALGVFSIVFLGVVPQLVSAIGPAGFFRATATMMLIAALATALFLPAGARPENVARLHARHAPRVRLAISGVTGMALIQGMVFGFVVQAGVAKGFAQDQIKIVLVVLGFINLVPPILAAALEKRLPALLVARIGALAQSALALCIMLAAGFGGYAVPAVFFSAVMIFTHTFVFGFLAHEDPSGRAVTATPAMLMTGSAIAPFLGGVLVELFGFAAIGIVAMSLGILCFALFTLAGASARVAKVAQ